MPQNDDWLEDLYADGANDQPPSDLDAKILTAAAHVSQAVHVPTQKRGSRRYVGWATAALVLLTVGVLFNSELLFLPDPASDIDVRTRVPAEQPNQDWIKGGALRQDQRLADGSQSGNGDEYGCRAGQVR